MLEFTVRVDGILSPEEMLKAFNLEPGGLAQQTLTKSVIDYMLPYWAWETGALANSAYDASDYAKGHIVYDLPYAAMMYYGADKNGRPITYNTSIHPQAGAYPLERMLADHEADIVEEVRRVATGE